MLIVIFLEDLLAKPGWLAVKLRSHLHRKRRNPEPRKRKMVRPVVGPLLRMRIRPNLQIQPPRRFLHRRIQRRPLRPRHQNIFGSPKRIITVEIQIQRRLPQRKNGMLTIVVRPQIPRLFRRHGQEQPGSPRLLLQPAPSPRQFHQNRAAGRVIHRPVIDGIPVDSRPDAQMIPMRAMRHHLRLQRRIAPWNHRRHVPGHNLPQLRRNPASQPDP